MNLVQCHSFLCACLLFAAAPGARGDWPEYRGPSGNGHAAPADGRSSVGLPLRWSETEHVKWKTAIPYRGWSTPVVLGSKVWLTTATLDGHDFFALSLNADTGRVLLQKKLFHTDNPEPLGNPVNCYASPSPVIEPGRVYVNFGSYGTACLDSADGTVRWQRRDIPCRHYRGPGSSPILFQDLLILTMDGVDLQYLIALDKQTGRTVWNKPPTADWNDLSRNGKPHGQGGDYAASLLYADGRIYCFSQAGLATVLKAGQKTEVLARNRLADGFMASPAVSGNALFLRTRTHLYRIEER